jgi:catechol 2,3-dioxygenase-like lactoylglutathione lyase family enzyme
MERGTSVAVSLKSVGAITLFVEDAERAKAFYGATFDLSPIYEDDVSAVFKFDNMLVNLLESSEAHALIAPAAVADPGAGSRVQLTVWTDDADAACAELERRGVTLLNGPVDRDWGMRTAAFADPDGHVWEIAQELAAAGG